METFEPKFNCPHRCCFGSSRLTFIINSKWRKYRNPDKVTNGWTMVQNLETTLERLLRNWLNVLWKLYVYITVLNIKKKLNN